MLASIKQKDTQNAKSPRVMSLQPIAAYAKIAAMIRIAKPTIRLFSPALILLFSFILFSFYVVIKPPSGFMSFINIYILLHNS